MNNNDPIETSFPNLQAELIKCFENNTKLKVSRISVSHIWQFNVQTSEINVPEENEGVFTIEIVV